KTANNKRLPNYELRAKIESISGITPAVTKYLAKNTVDSCYTIPPTKLPLNGTYLATVRANRFGNPLNGVSTFDLVVITRHILGMEPFTNVYQAIAADVNNSHSVTTFDIVETRKLILGIYDSFPGVPAWRLIHPLVNLTDFSALGAIKDTYQLVIPSLAADVNLNGINFVGIKTGDVNFSAQAFGSENESRGAPMILAAEDRYLKTGETVSVPIRMGESGELAGWQLALRSDPAALQILGVEGLDEENYLQAVDGSVRALWFSEHNRDFASGEMLFTLKIKALRPVWLAQALGLETEKMAAEAYTEARYRRPLRLEINAGLLPGIAFTPPQPNPFAAETVFQCRFDEAGTMRLEVFDATGRRVFDQTMATEAGPNTFPLSAAQLPAAGVYAYRISAGGKLYPGHLVRM
ncbi:MAG: T9SS type A sorting domain-containing protein, partial [Saprospiraceae bacterium]